MTPKEKKLLIFGGVGFAVFAVLFISLVAYFASGRFGRGLDGGADAPPPVAAKNAKAVTRGEFQSFVLGRFPEEVVKQFGPPTRTEEAQVLTMIYNNFTVDEITGRRDAAATVMFAPGGGAGARVSFR